MSRVLGRGAAGVLRLHVSLSCTVNTLAVVPYKSAGNYKLASVDTYTYDLGCHDGTSSGEGGQGRPTRRLQSAFLTGQTAEAMSCHVNGRGVVRSIQAEMQLYIQAKMPIRSIQAAGVAEYIFIPVTTAQKTSDTLQNQDTQAQAEVSLGLLPAVAPPNRAFVSRRQDWLRPGLKV